MTTNVCEQVVSICADMPLIGPYKEAVSTAENKLDCS